MAVRLRLTRVGSRKNPIWRVVVADGRSKRDGRVLETVGRYNPQRQPSEIILDRERIDHWIARGAQPSDTVRSLLRASEREAPPERAAASGGVQTPAAAPASTAEAEAAAAETGEVGEPADAGAPAPDSETAGEGEPVDVEVDPEPAGTGEQGETVGEAAAAEAETSADGGA